MRPPLMKAAAAAAAECVRRLELVVVRLRQHALFHMLGVLLAAAPADVCVRVVVHELGGANASSSRVLRRLAAASTSSARVPATRGC